MDVPVLHERVRGLEVDVREPLSAPVGGFIKIHSGHPGVFIFAREAEGAHTRRGAAVLRAAPGEPRAAATRGRARINAQRLAFQIHGRRQPQLQMGVLQVLLGVPHRPAGAGHIRNCANCIQYKIKHQT